MRTSVFCMLTVLILAVSANSRELTLTQALQLAQENAQQLRAAEAQSEAATSAIRAAVAQRFPTLTLSSSARYSSEIATLDIELPPPLNAHLSRELGSKDTYQTDLRLTMPVYTGGRISSAVTAARAAGHYSLASRDALRRAVMLQTHLEYLAVIQSMKTLQVAQASLSRSQIVSDDIANRLKAGTADSVAFIEAALGGNTARMAVTAAEAYLDQSWLDLKRTLGIDGDETITLSDSLPTPEPLSPRPELDPLSRPEARRASAAVELAKSQRRAALSEYLPTVAAYGGYSVGRPNIDPFADAWNDNFTVGGQLSWTFNVGGRAASKVGNAAWLLRSAEYQRQQVEDDLTREQLLAASQLKLAYSRYLSSIEALRLAADNYRIASHAHRQGVLPSNRLLEIESLLTSAELAKEIASVQYHMATARYYFASGSDKLNEGF
ncbi:MAG: TolC family protein [bacterium]